MKIAFIGVPIALGADRKGVEMAPDYFRETGVVKMINNIVDCFDLGNVHSSIIDEQIFAAHKNVKFLNTVVDSNIQLRDKVASVIRQGYFPLIVGGDHSLGLGSGAGVALACDNVGVIWFDAHGDFNTEETSPSGNSHGMPCAALMGWCKSRLNEVVTKKIPHQNFFWIGARDLDEGEVALAKKYGLHVYSSEIVRQRGIGSVMQEITEIMKNLNIQYVHLSIDIDGMDPKIVKGTGTRVENGLWNGDFYKFIDQIFATKMVVSSDFVEYNHLLDDEDLTTAKWCTEALHYLALKIKEL